MVGRRKRRKTCTDRRTLGCASSSLAMGVARWGESPTERRPPQKQDQSLRQRRPHRGAPKFGDVAGGIGASRARTAVKDAGHAGAVQIDVLEDGRAQRGTPGGGVSASPTYRDQCARISSDSGRRPWRPRNPPNSGTIQRPSGGRGFGVFAESIRSRPPDGWALSE